MQALPKWPALIVVGDSITPRQAAEIIIRTDHNVPDFEYSSNHRDLNKIANSIFGIPAAPKYPTVKDDAKVNAYHKKWQTWNGKITNLAIKLGKLDIEYLANAQIASNWIGGPHGWCNWDGRIFCNHFNIGKWPDANAVWTEWQTIAAAFPFLSLKAQLCNHEAGYPAEGQVSGPIVLYTVKDGKAEMTEQIPGQDPYIAIPNDESVENFVSNALLRGEWGITIQTLTGVLLDVYNGKIPQYND